MDLKPALLLIGPSGSGKSPLGALLEQKTGWAHFDFGHQLRLIARGEEIGALTDAERDFVKSLLHTHSLFPDDKFHIVEKILTDFLERNTHTPGVILNGLPRHIGQTIELSNIVEIKNVAVLRCPKRVSAQRISARVKGLSNDHSGRVDDTSTALEQKFVLYTRRTKPLIEHYSETGTKILNIDVGQGTSEADIAQHIMKSMY